MLLKWCGVGAGASSSEDSGGGRAARFRLRGGGSEDSDEDGDGGRLGLALRTFRALGGGGSTSSSEDVEGVRGFTGRTRLGGVSTTSPTSEEVAEITKRSAGTTSGVTGAAAGLTLFFEPFGRPAFRLVSSIPF